jgi:hypothetical protein
MRTGIIQRTKLNEIPVETTRNRDRAVSGTGPAWRKPVSLFAGTMSSGCLSVSSGMLSKSIIREKLQELQKLVRKGSFAGTRGDRFARKYAGKTSRMIREGISAMGKEAEETEQMARSFFKMLEAKLNLSSRSDPPSAEELRAAIEQLKDVGKFSVFATLVLLPGGIVSLVGLELLARKFGIKGFNLVPSSFRKNRHNTSPAPREDQLKDPD